MIFLWCASQLIAAKFCKPPFSMLATRGVFNVMVSQHLSFAVSQASSTDANDNVFVNNVFEWTFMFQRTRSNTNASVPAIMCVHMFFNEHVNLNCQPYASKQPACPIKTTKTPVLLPLSLSLPSYTTYCDYRELLRQTIASIKIHCGPFGCSLVSMSITYCCYYCCLLLLLLLPSSSSSSAPAPTPTPTP